MDFLVFCPDKSPNLVFIQKSHFPTRCHKKISEQSSLFTSFLTISVWGTCLTFIGKKCWSSFRSLQTYHAPCHLLFPCPLCRSALCPSLDSLAIVPSGASRLRCPSPPLCHGSLNAIGHGCLGPCCGGMCPQQALCPVTVSSYLSNPDQSLSAQSSLSQLSLVQPWRQQQPSATPPWILFIDSNNIFLLCL